MDQHTVEQCNHKWSEISLEADLEEIERANKLEEFYEYCRLRGALVVAGKLCREWLLENPEDTAVLKIQKRLLTETMMAMNVSSKPKVSKTEITKKTIYFSIVGFVFLTTMFTLIFMKFFEDY